MIRIIYILIFSFLSTFVVAQSTQQQYLGAPNTTIIIRGKLQVDAGFSSTKDTLSSADSGSLATKSNQLYIKLSSGKWVRAFHDSVPLNIMNLGAVGDGIHDDAPAFQYAANTGRYIDVPNPTTFYRLANTVNFNISGSYFKGQLSKIISDSTVISTFTLGYNVHDITFDGLWIKNQDTALTTKKGTVIKVQTDSVFAGDSTKYNYNLNVINCYITAPYGATRGIFIISHRNGFGGKFWNANISNNTFENIGAAAVEVLGEYNKVWCRDIRFTNNITKHTGLVNFPDGFGISISGADKAYIGNNYFSDYKIIGAECTVCSYSTIENNRFDSSSYTSTSPYTFNMSGAGIVGLGKDNSANNNKVLDSVPAPPYIVNQDNFKSSNNTIRYYSTYLRIDSVINSIFKGDTYVKTGTGSQPVIAIRAHSIGNVFSNCNIIGNSSNDQIILMQNGSKHNIFEHSKISGNTVSGTLINNADTTVSDNLVKDCYSTQKGALGIYYNLPIASSPAYSRVIDSNGQDATVIFGMPFLKITNTQRDALTPTEGLFIYSLTDHTLEFYNGTTWKQITTN